MINTWFHSEITHTYSGQYSTTVPICTSPVNHQTENNLHMPFAMWNMTFLKLCCTLVRSFLHGLLIMKYSSSCVCSWTGNTGSSSCRCSSRWPSRTTLWRSSVWSCRRKRRRSWTWRKPSLSWRMRSSSTELSNCTTTSSSQTSRVSGSETHSVDNLSANFF